MLLSDNSIFLSEIVANDQSASAFNASTIRDALAYVKANFGGGRVVVPSTPTGGYWIDGALDVPSYVTLCGNSARSVLLANGGFTGSHMVGLGGVDESAPPCARVENMTLNCFGKQISGVYSNKCQEGSGARSVIVSQYGSNARGFLFEGINGASPQNFALENVTAYSNAAATGSRAFQFSGSGTAGIVIKATATISGGGSQQETAIYVSAAKMLLQGVHLEGHADGIGVSTNGSAIVIDAEGFDGGSQPGKATTRVVSLYADAGPCKLIGVRAFGSQTLIRDNSVSPAVTISGANNATLLDYQNKSDPTA